MSADRWSVNPVAIAASMPLDLYRRHLGLPRAPELDGRAQALFDEALAWYGGHGTPWAHAEVQEVLEIAPERVVLQSGLTLTSDAIAAGFREAQVHKVAIIAASAGADVDAEVDRRWKEGRPDEAMFLSALSVAMAEHLRDRLSVILGEDQARLGLVSLPRYAPGYEGWDLSDQAALLAALADRGPLRVLPSGGLLPQKATVAVIGLSPRGDFSALSEDFWCRHRAGGGSSGSGLVAYGFPERALSKWSRERLQVKRLSGGRLLARFRFDGKTCGSLGRAFALDFEVELERELTGEHRILACSSAPAATSGAHSLMCAYMADPAGFQESLKEAPLLGQPLGAALEWAADQSPAPCLCLVASRNHKWRI